MKSMKRMMALMFTVVLGLGLGSSVWAVEKIFFLRTQALRVQRTTIYG